jgi:hypothetical protein
MPILEPYEVLELQDGQSIAFHVERYEEGTMFIKPTATPEGKDVEVCRVFVPVADKSHFPYYYDLTAKTLRAQLVPMLPSVIAGRRLITITKRGVAPKARFTVEVR